MNPILLAHKTANGIATAALSSNKTLSDIKLELKKLTKDALIDMLAGYMKTSKVTVESVARALLESEECTYLTYEDIASVISSAMSTKTTHKGVADYASKRPDWNVRPRKSHAERKTALTQLYADQSGESNVIKEVTK
jgi:hypothetical protein